MMKAPTSAPPRYPRRHYVALCWQSRFPQLERVPKSLFCPQRHSPPKVWTLSFASSFELIVTKRPSSRQTPALSQNAPGVYWRQPGVNNMPLYRLRMWDGKQEYIGDGHIGLLSTGDVIEYRAGGDVLAPRKSQGRMKYDQITLERGLTPASAFANWAAGVVRSASSSGSEVSPANLRKDVYLQFYNEGQLVVSYRISGGWMTEHLTQRGLVLHNLQLHDGKTVREKLAAIFEASLSRRS